MTDLLEAEAEAFMVAWREYLASDKPKNFDWPWAQAFRAGYDAGRATEAARYRDEALVERIARVLFEKEVENARMGEASLDEEFEANHEYWCESARAALAVIAEPQS